MENNHTQFLTDILAQIQSLKEQLEKLESMVSEHISDAESADLQGNDILDEDLPEAIGGEQVPSGPEIQPKIQPETQPEIQPKDEPEPVLTLEEDLPEATVPEKKEESAVSPSSASVEEDLPVFGIEVDDEIEVVPIGEAHAAGGAVMDRMAEKESWRTDMPGSSVSDIRSAISLNDRILFINTLFHEDPIAFKDTLSALNAMPSFDEGVKFIRERHPEWNTESDVVYRFMMAVRRKLK